MTVVAERHPVCVKRCHEQLSRSSILLASILRCAVIRQMLDGATSLLTIRSPTPLLDDQVSSSIQSLGEPTMLAECKIMIPRAAYLSKSVDVNFKTHPLRGVAPFSTNFHVSKVLQRCI